MSQFVPVAKVTELSPGQMKMVVADGERLLLVNMAGTFYVISDTCGHDWAPLSRGKLEGHVIVMSAALRQIRCAHRPAPQRAIGG